MNTAHKKREIAVYVRRRRVREKMLDGHTNQTEIAAGEKVTPATINGDFQAIYKEWREEDPKEIELLKLIRIKELQLIKQKAMDAYEKSCESTIETTTVSKPEKCNSCDSTGKLKRKECKVCQGTGYRVVEVQTQRTKGRAGDAVYLAESRKCTMEMAKMQGCYPEKKGEIINLKMETRILHTVLDVKDESNPYLGAPKEMILEAKSLKHRLDAYINGKVIEGEVVK